MFKTLLTALLALTTLGAAAQDYPNRPLRMVVPFAPGGGADIVARAVAGPLARRLGQTIVVENKAGGGAPVGADLVAKAPADGYTLLFGTSSTQVSGPLLLATPPYDPQKDFRMLMVGVVPMVLTVRPGLPVESARDLIALIRATPGKYTYSSAGPGSINHPGIELLKLRAGGLNALHVPYKGTNPAQVALMAGEVDFMIRIVAKEWESYQRFLTENLTSAKNVTSVKTMPLVRTAKEEPGVPIDVEEAK